MTAIDATIQSDLRLHLTTLEHKADHYRDRIKMLSANLADDVTRIAGEVSDTTRPFCTTFIAQRAAEIDKQSEGLYQTLAEIKTINQILARDAVRGVDYPVTP